jgi:hypothetical protein
MPVCFHIPPYVSLNVMRMTSLIVCILTFVAGQSIAQTTNTYRDMTAGKETIARIQEVPIAHGLIIRSVLSNGDYYEVEYGDSNTTVRYRVQSPNRKIDYTARRVGNIITFEGTLGGKQISRKQQVDNRPWFETIETSLSAFALSGSRTPLLFWIVQPWEGKAYLMQAIGEGEETVTAGAVRMKAMRLRVRASGFFSRFWSSLYWYRSTDGLYVRYEAARGIPGTPLTVVELIPNR